MTLPRSEGDSVGDKDPGEQTDVGNYFVANYPPFSAWKRDHVAAAEAALQQPPEGPEVPPLGLYLHIPFCRKRCKFCYFRVYTDKNSKEVERYAAALSREVDLYHELPAVRDRQLKFAYFGGGTPSFLSARQLRGLVERLRSFVSWDTADEVTFECEPGTLSETKLEAIRDIGVTRLSLGVENFSDAILEENGRAHLSKEIFRAYDWARGLEFDQINIDLIAGMVGETEENWKDCVRKTIDLSPDCVTVYQMELPFNTVYSQDVLGGKYLVADWKTKREWVDHAFNELAGAGYAVSSAYTLVRDPSTRFVYRDSLWHGADMLGTGVASFSHVGGVHFQNADRFDEYVSSIERGELPLGRALTTTPRQRLIRELILQMKLGRVEAGYFRAKFGIDILEEFAPVLGRHQANGMLRIGDDRLILTRRGLLRADSLLEAFFEPEYRQARYT